jgi:hypothetical protein
MTGEVRDLDLLIRDKARIVMIVQDGRIMKDRVQEASCRTTR